VILCAGGFILNKEMLARFTPGALACTKEVSGGNDDGSGIRMGMAVGGAAIHMDQFFATVPFFPPASLVKGIFINGRGERFINEDAYHGRVAHYVLRQPEGKAWLLVDDEIFGRPVIKPDVTVAAVGESWEEIETELGLPAGSLVHTVETFNAQAAAGSDPLFHKAPTGCARSPRRPLRRSATAAPTWRPTPSPSAASPRGRAARCWMVTASRSAGCLPRGAAPAACRAGARATARACRWGIPPSSAVWRASRPPPERTRMRPVPQNLGTITALLWFETIHVRFPCPTISPGGGRCCMP
jgi:hypothetical protein